MKQYTSSKVCVQFTLWQRHWQTLKTQRASFFLGMSVLPEMNFRREECFILTGDIGFVTQDQLVSIEPVDDGVDGPHGRVNWRDIWAFVCHADWRFAFCRQTLARLQVVDVIGRLDLEVLLLRVRLNVGEVDDLSEKKSEHAKIKNIVSSKICWKLCQILKSSNGKIVRFPICT